jgi:hypothetical protein
LVWHLSLLALLSLLDLDAILVECRVRTGLMLARKV